MAIYISRKRKLQVSGVLTIIFTAVALFGALHGPFFPKPCENESIPSCDNGIAVTCSDGSAFEGPTPDHPHRHHHHSSSGCMLPARPVCSNATEDIFASLRDEMRERGELRDEFQTAVDRCAATKDLPKMVAACVADMGPQRGGWCETQTQRVWGEFCVDMVNEKLSPRCSDGSLPRSPAARMQLFVDGWRHKHSGEEEEHKEEHGAHDTEEAGDEHGDGHEHGHDDKHSKHHHCHGGGAAVMAIISGVSFLVLLRKERSAAAAATGGEAGGEKDPLRERLCCSSKRGYEAPAAPAVVSPVAFVAANPVAESGAIAV